MTTTSTEVAQWHSVPADDKKNVRLIISEIILGQFRSLKMAYPELGEASVAFVLEEIIGISVFANSGRLGVFSLGYDDLTDALTNGMA